VPGQDAIGNSKVMENRYLEPCEGKEPRPEPNEEIRRLYEWCLRRVHVLDRVKPMCPDEAQITAGTAGGHHPKHLGTN